MDYGSGAAPTGYNIKYDFGFSVAIGGATGYNCSFDDVQMNGNAWQDTVCPMYDAVMQAASGGKAAKLNCTWTVANGIDYGFANQAAPQHDPQHVEKAAAGEDHALAAEEDRTYTQRGPWRRFRKSSSREEDEADAGSSAGGQVRSGAPRGDVKCNYTFPHFEMGDDLKPLSAPTPQPAH